MRDQVQQEEEADAGAGPGEERQGEEEAEERRRRRREHRDDEVAEDEVDGIGRRDGVAEIGKAVESVARGGTSGDTFDGSLLRLRLRLNPTRTENPRNKTLTSPSFPYQY